MRESWAERERKVVVTAAETMAIRGIVAAWEERDTTLLEILEDGVLVLQPEYTESTMKVTIPEGTLREEIREYVGLKKRVMVQIRAPDCNRIWPEELGSLSCQKLTY